MTFHFNHLFIDIFIDYKENDTIASPKTILYIYIITPSDFILLFRKRGFMYMYLKYFTSEMILVTHSFYAFIKLTNEQFNDLNKFLRIHGQIQ